MTQETSNASSTWEKIIEPRTETYSNGETYHYELFGIKRLKDGFTLIIEEQRREMNEVFLCQGDFGEFRFFAQRWEIEPRRVTDTYIVQTKLGDPSWSGDRELQKTLLLAHAKDIEEALKSLPAQIVFGHDLQPVKKVLFQLKRPSEGSKIVHVEEI